MLYKTTCPLAIKGSRVEKGTEVELSEKELSSIDPADISPVVDEVVEPEVIVEVAIEDMDIDQLKAKAKTLGLKSTGSKADLIERITLNA